MRFGLAVLFLVPVFVVLAIAARPGAEEREARRREACRFADVVEVRLLGRVHSVTSAHRTSIGLAFAERLATERERPWGGFLLGFCIGERLQPPAAEIAELREEAALALATDLHLPAAVTPTLIAFGTEGLDTRRSRSAPALSLHLFREGYGPDALQARDRATLPGALPDGRVPLAWCSGPAGSVACGLQLARPDGMRIPIWSLTLDAFPQPGAPLPALVLEVAAKAEAVPGMFLPDP